MLVITRRTGQSLICCPDSANNVSQIPLARVVGDTFITIQTVTHRHCWPELEIIYPDDLLSLNILDDNRRRYFDLLIRETINPADISLEDLFARGPIQVTLKSQHRQHIRLGISAPHEIKVLRNELLRNPRRHRRQGHDQENQGISQRLIA